MRDATRAQALLSALAGIEEAILAKTEKILVAMASDVALVLTGNDRGEVWRVEDPPGDGLWMVDYSPSRVAIPQIWRSWCRPTENQLIAYQRSAVN